MFGAQKGHFSITFVSIAAYKDAKALEQHFYFPFPYHDTPGEMSTASVFSREKAFPVKVYNQAAGFWSAICCCMRG